ncbi:methylation-associated defense system ATP-binding protein MAD8 [Phocaeicola abscessus]|uniref:methylation-associated defense system ATP-binding protein MAD8 n=1 Tax=Phocaeicola abscessus TaxID=555313 RepID=UPI0004B28554|nr:ATP-binding protein [Phocaeicola abscessus]
MDIQSLYYEKFLALVVEFYREDLKQAKPGHCMKVTGLAMNELKQLLPLLKPINKELQVFILSDAETGPDYIHATKLIELRNNNEKPLLVLIPANSRTSAEDSYGDATFQDLAVKDLQIEFWQKLNREMPDEQKPFIEDLNKIFNEFGIPLSDRINYLLYMEICGWKLSSWGEGLAILGLLPDSKLMDNLDNIRSRFVYNRECTNFLCDFSLSPVDKASALPLAPDTIQKDIVKFFQKENDVFDNLSVCLRILEDYPNLYFSEWRIKSLEDIEKNNVVVTAEIVPGKDPDKELVKDTSGDLIMQIPNGKKSKLKVKITFNPSPAQLPLLEKYLIQLVNQDGYQVVEDCLKMAKINSKNSSKTVTIPINYDAFDDGQYFLRVHALDGQGLQLDKDNPFKPDSIQALWEMEHEQNPDLPKEQFHTQGQYLTTNETTYFTIKNLVDGEPPEDIDTENSKRNHPDNMLQAYFTYRIETLRKAEQTEEIVVPEISEKTEWKTGTLNDVYHFDYGKAAYAYQIQCSKKLLELERAFYKHCTQLGRVLAEISGNPTDTKLQDWSFEQIPAEVVVPQELKELRSTLFNHIQMCAASESGVLNIFPIYNYTEEIKAYVNAYSQWLHSFIEGAPNESALIAIQNIDTVLLNVEMPDGGKQKVKLLSPLHPLRLAWLINLYDLFQDWESKTIENPDYKSQWKDLAKLFMGELPMDVSPLVLPETSMQIYQYVGELTFGWGLFAIPTIDVNDTFASEFRQLKSYVSSLLNISRDKTIDSDVSKDLVFHHMLNYVKSHPYTNKLVMNLFNAGDANVFADAMVEMEKYGKHYDYEIRLFADDRLIQPGEALRDLINPETNQSEAAEVFSLASKNRLFPKLRFSINPIQDFINNHQKYQAHLSFLVNPFPVVTGMARPQKGQRSFYLNGVIVKSQVGMEVTTDKFSWNRYFAEKAIPSPINEFANDAVSLFANLQYVIGKIISSTAKESVPATKLILNENESMMLSFVHEVSDWVVTFDKNMGPEFYDLPQGEGQEAPYLLDYIPGQERTGISSFLTTRPTSEIEGLMKPHFKKIGINVEDELFKELLEDVRTVSSSLVMQVNSTQNKAFEVLGMTFTKRLLKKKNLLSEAFLIPIDLHKELFENLESQKKNRADALLVNLNTESREIVFTVIEVKCRQSLTEDETDNLEEQMLAQIENTIEALKEHFEKAFAESDRLDRELKTLELANLLNFYIDRANRYNILDPEMMIEFRDFLNTLNEGYDIKFKRMGIIYDLSQQEKQKKDCWGDAVFYRMGYPVIHDILSKDKTLNTERLSQEDVDFISFMEPNRKETIMSKRRQKREIERIIQDEETEPSVKFVNQENHSDIVSSDSSLKIEDENPSEKADSVERVSEKQDSQRENEILTSNDSQRSVMDTNYVEPEYDILLGKESQSSQYGILGHTVVKDKLVAVDLDGCNTFSLFGVQGAGKSYTIGTVTEMVLKQFSKVNKLQAPLASVIFHYSDSMDYAPEFTSMAAPNDDARQLALLKERYGAEAGSVEDVILLAPDSKVEERRAEYPNIEVHPIGFDSSELQVKDWMFLLGAMGNDSTYIRELKMIMKKIRSDMSLRNIRRGVAASSSLSNGQKALASQRLDFAEEYITDGTQLRNYLKPGRLIIVDLRDEFIEKNEALGLFVVMLNIFSGVMQVDGQAFNKFIVFDEAHKYMNDKELVGSITTAIREMRHKGVSIMIASQDPMSLPNEIIELSSIVLLHRFNSPQWVKHVQKSITPLGSLTAAEMSSLKSGEAYLWANKASDSIITSKPVKINVRPRVTKHGGDTIQAVK